MRYKVSFRPEAEADLFALYHYISDRSGPMRAGDYITRIETACMALATFPERGTKRDDLEPGVRTVPFERSAVIAYKVESDQVRIGNIFYGGRNFEALYRGGAPPDDEDDGEQAES